LEKQDTPTQANPARRTISRLALPVFLVVLTGFTAYNTLAASGAFHTQFPQSQTFSLGVAYNFANTKGSLLLPGSTGNVTLTVVSALSQPQTIRISFNATDPEDWTIPYVPGCTLGAPNILTMTINSQVLAPVNSGQGCSVSVPVTVNPGQNTYTAFISVASTATASTVFTLNWFADQ